VTSRERVRRALNRKPTDRAPVDWWGTPEAEAAVRARLGADFEQMLKALGVDLRYVTPKYAGPPLPRYPDGSWEDVWRVRRAPVRAGGGSYDEVVCSPLADCDDEAGLEAWSWPSADWYDYAGVRGECERHAGYAIVLGGDRLNRTTFLHLAMYLRGMEQGFLDIAERPKFVRRLFEKVGAFFLEMNRRMFEAAEGRADIFLMGDDFGTQRGLLISPAAWRELIAPHLAAQCALAHRRGLRVMHHSCGAIRELIPDLIEVGVDILNPVQVRAAGMNPVELKRDFGDRLCFHGGVDVQQTLPRGTPAAVRAETAERIRVLGDGGGYILAPTHNFQWDVPVDNILAMYAEAGSYGENA